MPDAAHVPHAHARPRPARLDRLVHVRLPAARPVPDVRRRCCGSCCRRSRPRRAHRISAEPAADGPKQRRRCRARTSRSPVYRVTLPDGTTRELAELRRIGLMATMVGPGAARGRSCACRSTSASRCASSASPPRTTPSSSASSTSAAICGTACSSRWSPRSSRCCSTRWRRSRCRSIASAAARSCSC